MQKRKSRSGALEAVLQETGTLAKLAKQLGISRAAISQWQEVPVHRVLEVEKITGVSRYQLRPDIYGSRPKKAA